MADEPDASYNNTNRAFLQAFIAHSTLTFEQAKPILASILGVHEKRPHPADTITEPVFHAYITAANAALSPLDLEIRSCRHQITRVRVYALVNCASDDLTQLATVYSAEEIGFLRRVLDAMFEGEGEGVGGREVMAVTSMQAVALAKGAGGEGGQGLTMMQAEKMLRSLVEEGWFEKSARGYFGLSPRGLMELRGWLCETYNEEEDEEEGGEEGTRIKMCFGCREIVTIGQRCARRDCACRLHDDCCQQLFRTQDSRKCPLCRTEWTGNDFVGERAAAGGKEKPRKRRSGGGGGGSFVRRRSPIVVQEDDDAEEATVEEDGD